MGYGLPHDVRVPGTRSGEGNRVVFLVAVTVVAVTAALLLGRNRHTPDPLERHERALSALRDLAERLQALPPAPEAAPSDHVHLVAAPAEPRPARSTTGPRRRAGRATRPVESDDRPVIAWLPTRPGGTEPAGLPATPPAAVAPEPIRLPGSG